MDDTSGQSMTCDFAEGDRLFMIALGDSKHIRAVATLSQQLAEGYLRHKIQNKSFEEVVPLYYHLYKDVFTKESFD